MSSVTTTTTRPHRQSTILLGAARVLLGVMGLLGLAGALFFTFVASPAEGGVVGGFDWFIAAWKAVVSLGFLAVAVAPRMHPGRRIQLATWLVLADIVFGLVKYFGYDEREPINLAFFVVNALLLGLLHLAGRAHR